MALRSLPRTRRSRAGRGEQAADEGPQPVRPRLRGRYWWIALAVVVTLLVLVRFVASPIVTGLVNRQLGGLDSYEGRAGAVKLALWRGAIVIDDLILREKGHPDDPPVLHARSATMRIAPAALFAGKLGGAAVVDGVQVNVVKRERVSPEEAADEAGRELQEKKEQVQRWQEVLRQSFPVTLRSFELKNGRVRYLDRSHQPAVDVELTQLHIVARDLQNRPKANGDDLPAKLELSGVMTGGGRIHSTVELDPIARQPRFAAKFEVRELALPPLNSFLRAYADADVSRGRFELYLEVQARDGAYDGYLKPLFHELDFRTASDENKNLAQKAKETVVDAVTSLLRNDERRQVATKAPFRGNFADNDVDIWTTVAELFRNAFVQALRGGFEGEAGRS